jgi:hypothetical protein
MKLKREDKSRSLHCAASARPAGASGMHKPHIRERKKKPAAPVGMTGLHVEALENR